MKRLDRIQLGKWVRKTRKAKRLRQEDLVDDILSQTAISNIESGKTHVSEEKLTHLLKKLGYSPDELADFYLNDVEQDTENIHEEMELRLTSIENTIDLVGPDEGLEELRNLGLSNDSSFQVIVSYLRGKCYMHKQNWKKAHKQFFDCIHSLIHHHPEMQYTNLKAACYQELSFIEYSQNNFREALIYSTEGLKSFLKEGQRQYYREIILISKAVYLQKLNRLEDAQSVLEELSRLKTEPCEKEKEGADFPLMLESKEVMLNLMELQASFLMKSSMYCQAIKYALKGIELARVDRLYDRSFELWTTLGSIYSKKENLQLAEICFLTALKLRKKIKREYLLAYVYTQLGLLYNKANSYKRAEQNFLEAIRFSHKTNDVYREVEALTELGLCYWEQKKPDKALEHLHLALQLAEKRSIHNQKNKLLLLLGSFLQKMGDPNYQKYAIDFFKSHVLSLKGGEQEMLKVTRQHADPPNG